MNQTELKNRTKQFALAVIQLVSALPYNIVNRNLGDQLLRSATSVSANYRAACKARSKAEFIAKLGICAEEADEAMHWLELFIESKIADSKEVMVLQKEANELASIFVASIKTLKQNHPLKSQISHQKS